MRWLQELSSHPVVESVVCLVLVLLALVLRQLAHRSRLAHRLDASFTLVVAGLLVGALGTAVGVAGGSAAVPYFQAVLVGALGIGGVRAALTLFVDFYLRQREGAAVSAIVRDVSSVVAYFLVVVLVLRSTLDINLTSLVATSAVLTVIVGLALQDVLSNLFSGLVLELEEPFKPGDWVRVGVFEGAVEETGWRTTKLRTRVNELVTLPNALISKEAVVNYSRPDPLHGDTLYFDAAYEAPPSVVKQAAMAVLAEEAEVVHTPTPEVRLLRYAESSVGYALRYFVTDFDELERTRDRIMTNLWYALDRAGVRIPLPAREVFVYPGVRAVPAPDNADVASILRRVALLAPLDDAALEQLAPHVRRVTFGTGELVVREGEAGNSFFVIERGTVDVILGGDGSARAVGRLGPGDFFGEMSLLAGEPRTATVRAVSDLTVVVVDHAAFKEIITADPAILEPLSEIAARRHAAQQEHRRLRASLPSSPADPHGAQWLRERIRAFFGL